MASARIDFIEFEKAKYFPALDGMRAICVLLVMFNHVHLPYPHWIVGMLGVDVFFVLSGFLITTLMLRERERAGRISLKGFYTRRFFRIVPIYLITVLLYAVAIWWTRDPAKAAEFKAALPWLLSFMQEYKPAEMTVMGHAWTLGIEEKFYVFWPLLVIWLFPFRGRSVAWLGALLVGTLALPLAFSRSYGGLLFGAVLAIALSAPAQWTFIRRLPAVPDVVLCLLVAGTYALCGYNLNFVLLFSGSIALLMASLLLRRGLVRTILENRLLVYIGKRSYAMYLIHVLVLAAVGKILLHLTRPNWIAEVGISYLASLGVAAIMQVAIERPCIAVGRRLSKRFAERTRVSPAVAGS